MTYDFYYKHVSPHLNDDECEKLWAARPPHIDKEAEDSVAALLLEAIGKMHSEIFPEFRRVSEAA
jgi:hypothetical protein